MVKFKTHIKPFNKTAVNDVPPAVQSSEIVVLEATNTQIIGSEVYITYDYGY